MKKEKKSSPLWDLIFIAIQFVVIAFMFGTAVYYFTKV